MKRRAPPGSGFWMSLLLNMIFQGQWLLAALGMLALHYWLHLPKFLFWVCIIIWILWSLAVTLFVSWAAGTGSSNPGPGGHRTSERLRQQARQNKHE